MNSKELKVSKRFYRAESALDLLEYLDHGEQAQVENRWTLEAAWEVANKGMLNILKIVVNGFYPLLSNIWR